MSSYFMRSAFAILVTKPCTYTFNIYVDTRIDDVDVYALTRIWDVNIVVLVFHIHASINGVLASKKPR
jgi:hypothetical protein